MCACRSRRRYRRRAGRDQRGVTLIEVVLFIVIIGIALSAVVHTLAFAAARSGDPLVQRQALAIAQSLMQEIQAQPFTLTNPDGSSELIGPERGETRGGITPFNNVNDYHGYATQGIVDATGTPVPGLAVYSVAVTVQNQAFDDIPAADGLLISITVTGPGGTSVTLTGFSVRTSST